MYEPGDIEWVPFPKEAVSAIDAIVHKAKVHGVDTRIETDKHWEIAQDLFNLWVKFFPQEYAYFRQQQIDFKKAQLNKHGASEEKGGAKLQHILEIHPRFLRLLMGIFPDVDKQLVGKKHFAIKMAQKLPILKIPEKI